MTSNKVDRYNNKMDGENTRVKFTNEQIKKLNFLFGKKIDKINIDTGNDQSMIIAERLTQRLLCAIGKIDSRFSSKFLITIQNNIGFRKKYLEYLVRLDDLSTPVLYETDQRPRIEIFESETDSETPGYSKIFLRDTAAKKWSEFINNSGYLRRDKVQEKFVELLAVAASTTWPNTPQEVDDSVLCGSPGKVIDAFTAQEIFKLPNDEQIYYGTAINMERYPEPRDFRLAIIDEPNGVKLRIGFLSPSLAGSDIEVRLLLAIGLEQWPRTCSFPQRIPLEHSECLLFYQAAETGMYLVACGQYSANWLMITPAAEALLSNHHGNTSTVSIVLETLQVALNEIHIQCKDFTCQQIWKQFNQKFLRHLLWYYMESDDSNPVQLIQNWTLKTISKHVLHLLEILTNALRQQFQGNYFFEQQNLFVNPGNIFIDDYNEIGEQIQNYITQLYDISLEAIKGDDYLKMEKYEEVDVALVEKWGDVIQSVLPPAATRSRRFSFAVSKNRQEVAYTQYTKKQLEYIGLLLKHMLTVKKLTMQTSITNQDLYPIQEAPIEDVIFLLVTIMEQVWKSKKAPRNPKNTLRTKSRANFDAATTKLVEMVRKNKDTLFMNFKDDIILVQTVLRWLYKGLDQSKHSLAPILRPYLQKLFISSHEICWHLDSIKNQEIKDEIHALGIYSKLVTSKKMSPASGLIESINKGWNWAKNILSIIEEHSTVTLIFTPKRGKFMRHVLCLPTHEKDLDNLIVFKKLQEAGQNTLSKKFNSLWKKENMKTNTNRNTLYSELKEKSPLSLLMKQKNRFGNHRCFGDLIYSLITFNKISCLQEISILLPQPERQNVLTSIQQLSKENKKYLTLRRKTLPRREDGSGVRQSYIPVEESAGMRKEKTIKKGQEKREDKKDSLIENCRNVRILDDCKVCFSENLKLKGIYQFNTD